MLILGHAGITLGAAVLLNGTLAKNYSFHPKGDKVIKHPQPSSDSRISWLTSLGNRIDIRLLLIGSLLPDIIDKPVGLFFSNGRLFCHTLLFLILLFLIVISLAGLYLYRSHAKLWLLTLSFGTFTHLIFDQMWLTPRTLLWPLYGWSFEKLDLTHWMQRIFYALVTNPTVYVPELIGGVILIWFALRVMRRKQVYAFIRNGQA